VGQNILQLGFNLASYQQDLGLRFAATGALGPEFKAVADVGIRLLGKGYTFAAETNKIVKGTDGFPAPSGGLAKVQDDVSALRDTADAIPDDVWNEGWLDVGEFSTPGNALSEVVRAAEIYTNHELKRFWESPSFLTWNPGLFDSTIWEPLDLQDCVMSAILPGETAIAMCERLHPEVTFTVSDLPSFSFYAVDPSHLNVRYYWSPPPPTLQEIKELFRYTPASGPPDRYASTDMCRILSMLPVQWGDAGSGP